MAHLLDSIEEAHLTLASVSTVRNMNGTIIPMLLWINSLFILMERLQFLTQR